MPQTRKRVAILIRGHLNAYLSRMVMGVAEYARLDGRWAIHGLFIGRPVAIWPVHADGAIVFRGGLDMLRGRIPAVQVGTFPPQKRPRGTVQSDNFGIGAAAANHLIERGVRYFSAVGERTRSQSSEERCEGFSRRVRQAGLQFIAGPALNSSKLDERRQRQTLGKWIAGLPKPVGIMGYNDIVARQIADTCRLAGEAVPDRVAIVGVDNEELMCMLADPPLSSVDPSAQRVGFEAASLLEKLMRGQQPPREPIIVPAGKVVVRQSSDVLAIDDDDVVDAVRFIRDNCAKPITIGDVLRHVPVPRRSLDRRFRRKLGRSMHDELQRARIGRAGDMLVGSTLPIPQIATQCGYSSREYFSAAFMRATGEAPAAYRKKRKSPTAAAL